jgi:hypothetical protein
VEASRDFQVEIVDGVLRVSVRLPTTACGLCRVVHRQVLGPLAGRSLDANRVLHTAPSHLCELPDFANWKWVYPRLGDPVLLCPACSAPIREAEAAGEAATRLARGIVELKLLEAAP